MGTEQMAVVSASPLKPMESLNGTAPRLNGVELAARPIMSGAEIVCAALEAEGVEVVFGYPGGAGLTAGAVFGRLAGEAAARHASGARAAQA